MKKAITLLMVLAVTATTLFAAPVSADSVDIPSSQERNRGFYIDFGLGSGSINYFAGDIKSSVADFESDANIRMILEMPMLTAGWALTQNFYLVGSISGVNDLFYDSLLGESENGKGGGIGIYMYGIGARYYPLANKKHLQLGLDLGPSGMAIVRYAGLDNEESHESWGFSTRFSVGWDFDSTMTGFGAILGADIMFNTIDGDTSLFSGLFFKLLFK